MDISAGEACEEEKRFFEAEEDVGSSFSFARPLASMDDRGWDRTK
jgi:hypothetical protein